jgi:hypothetical protein
MVRYKRLVIVYVLSLLNIDFFFKRKLDYFGNTQTREKWLHREE